MNRTKILLMLLVAAAVLMSLWTAAYAAGQTENVRETLDVQTWKGKHVGSVKYVVMDPPGNVAFLIVYYDAGRKEIAVPVAAFSSFNKETGILILKVSESQLASAPEFHESDLDNPAFSEDIYRFFGLTPFW